jgi:hypothetical protein
MRFEEKADPGFGFSGEMGFAWVEGLRKCSLFETDATLRRPLPPPSSYNLWLLFS